MYDEQMLRIPAKEMIKATMILTHIVIRKLTERKSSST